MAWQHLKILVSVVLSNMCRAVDVSVTKEMCGDASQHIMAVKLQPPFARGALYLQRCLHYLNYRGLGHDASCYFPLDSSRASTLLTLWRRDQEKSLAGPKQVSVGVYHFFGTQSNYRVHKEGSKKSI